jgi:tRNA (cmo5U34)-methyltransferase
MTIAVKDAFGLTAREYDRARRQLVPCFDDFYRSAVEALPFAPDAAPQILDLGAGTGLLSGFIAAAFPRAQLTLIDIAPAMLTRARERFANHPERVKFMLGDLAASELMRGPEVSGGYDAIVSALAIHHLDDDGKRRLFRTIHAALKPGGVFVNAEQIAGATPALDRRYHEDWLRRVRELGVSQADLAAALGRMKLDRCATVGAHFAWLREAALTEVDCPYKDGMFAVMTAVKPPA